MNGGHIGTDRSLLTGHNALLLRRIARDLLHVISHRHGHDNTWTAFGEPVVVQAIHVYGQREICY